MFRFLGLGIVLTFLTISSANAIVFIEPFGGYATGTFGIKATDIGSGMSISEDLDMKGLNYGARGGLELGGLQLGLDYVQNNLEIDDGKDIELDDDEFKVTEMAAFLGYRFWFARIYGGYIFSADIDDSDFDPGTGFKFGGTFYAFEHLAISLEYRSVDVKSENIEGIKLDPDYNTTAILVSIPFSI